MDGKISREGYLFISRGEKLKQQYCMFSIIHSERGNIDNGLCGDHCPHFGRPFLIGKKSLTEMRENTEIAEEAGEVSDESRWVIDICQEKTLVFDDLVDERPALTEAAAEQEADKSKEQKSKNKNEGN